MLIYILIVTTLVIAIITFLQSPIFGKFPSGERLERIKKSPNYKDGSFRNISHTTIKTEGDSFFKIFKEFLLTKNRKPKGVMPTVKTDLMNLNPDDNILVWFGHSSYFMQIGGKKILFDPVLSGSVSPVCFTNKAFKGTDVYSTDDIPEIDYLFISHDHWDHLDYNTLTGIRHKVKNVICGLGTGEHIERWGYSPDIIIEKDWDEKIVFDDNFIVHTVTSRHFSGRTLKRNKTLWTSFIIETPSLKIFMGSDGGYDKHFADAGKTFGAFDLAILENGQYNNNWRHIHMLPEEVIMAAKDLNAKRILPIHSCKFILAIHLWADPLKAITELNKKENLNIITPLIGEQVNLSDNSQKFSNWWENVR